MAGTDALSGQWGPLTRLGPPGAGGVVSPLQGRHRRSHGEAALHRRVTRSSERRGPTIRDHRQRPRLRNVDAPSDHDRHRTELADRAPRPARQTPDRRRSRAKYPSEIPARTCIRKCRHASRAHRPHHTVARQPISTAITDLLREPATVSPSFDTTTANCPSTIVTDLVVALKRNDLSILVGSARVAVVDACDCLCGPSRTRNDGRRTESPIVAPSDWSSVPRDQRPPLTGSRASA